MLILHYPVLMTIFVFICGITITSFSCLAAERLPHQLGWIDNPRENYTVLYPPSMCNNCGKKIRFIYLIPIIGFVLTRGKCSYCHKPILWRYPLLELFGGGGSVYLFIHFGCGFVGILAVAIFLCLIFLSLIDIYEHWLPAIVTYPLFWFGLAFSPFCIVPEMRIMGAMAAFFIMCTSMLITGMIKKEDLFAGGDVALATAAGSWLGLEMLPEFLLISSLSFIVYAFPLRLKGVRYSPMGPALACGFMACLFLL